MEIFEIYQIILLILRGFIQSLLKQILAVSSNGAREISNLYDIFIKREPEEVGELN